MRTSCTVLTVLSILAPSLAYAYGEGADIPAESRAIHVLVNEARSNTRNALSECGSRCSEGLSCYEKVLEPLYWHDGLYRAAQFHANMLSAIHCMQHDSPCTLVSTVNDDFPGKCDGNPECACVDKEAKCGTVGTETFTRVKMFSDTASGENLASAIGVQKTFDLWMFEDGKGDGCTFTMNNGHRRNILAAGSKSIGIGYASYIASQDMGGSTKETSKLTAGAWYESDGLNWFKTHYFSPDTELLKVTVYTGGQCTYLSNTNGNRMNGAWGTSQVVPTGECMPYFFEAEDKNGSITRFPTTGELLYKCNKSWQESTVTASCLNGSIDISGEMNDGSDSGCSSMPQKPSDSKGLFMLFGILALLGFRRIRKA